MKPGHHHHQRSPIMSMVRSASIVIASWGHVRHHHHPSSSSSSWWVSAWDARVVFSTRAFHARTTTGGASTITTRRPPTTAAPRFFATSLHGTTATTDTDSTTTTTTTPVPITLLSGFLGSGKTTALQKVLENKAGLRVGVVVNDMASVNIDAKLIRNPIHDNDYLTESDGTVELENGCACCSLADEFLVCVEKLCRGRDFDAVLVELSGVADPVAVKNHWDEAKLVQHPVTSLATVSKIVTVIDSSTFGTDWMTWNTVGERPGWVPESDQDCSKQRKVPELLAEQVESADVLILNKVDLADADQIRAASALVRGLNPKAPLIEVTYGDVDPARVIGMETKKEPHEPCQDEDCGDAHCSEHGVQTTTTSTSTHHDHDHDHSHSHEHTTKKHPNTSLDHLGIVNFVYKSDRPFHSPRLLALLNRWPVPVKDELDLGQFATAAERVSPDDSVAFVGVLRSKGFVWLAPVSWVGPGADTWRHDTAMYWSHAGKHFGITSAGQWWGTVSREDMEAMFDTMPEEYERILREDFVSEEFGDRRQEIVFIGTNLDEELITKELDACLLTDQEMSQYRREARRIAGVY